MGKVRASSANPPNILIRMIASLSIIQKIPKPENSLPNYWFLMVLVKMLLRTYLRPVFTFSIKMNR